MNTTKTTVSRRPIIQSAFTAFVLAAVAGCAVNLAGVSGYDNFLKSTSAQNINGIQSPLRAGQCFEEQAIFLPLSEFSREPGAEGFTYRLRVAGTWFEQIKITHQGDGSRAEIRVAPHLNARWRTQFDQDRRAALLRYLGS